MRREVGLGEARRSMHDVAEGGHSELRQFCICIIEFLSGLGIDPHLYFQQRMIGELAQAKSVDELIELMRRLIGWVDAMATGPAQGDRLDTILMDRGFPPLSGIRAADNKDVVKMLVENG